MIITIIVAVAKNGVIGIDNDLPWHLHNDMMFFKATTKGHHVLTGRKNYDSIPERFRPLPSRVNIVVTRNSEFEAPGAIIVGTIEEGIELAKSAGEEELFIMGGGQIYDQMIGKDIVDKMYITWVEAEPNGDTHFPDVDYSRWKEVDRKEYAATDNDQYAHSIVTYLRKS